MTTEMGDSGPITSAIMDKPLQASPISSQALPSNVIPEAFEDLGDCMPRQLGAILKQDWEELAAQLGDIQETSSNRSRGGWNYNAGPTGVVQETIVCSLRISWNCASREACSRT